MTFCALCGTDAMPETAETLAREHRISREDQDRYALLTQSRYNADWHATDIVPITAPSRKEESIVSNDEHPRTTSLEKLAALPTPFRTAGTVTAGNASGVNDGAAAVLLASATAVRQHGFTPLARIGQAAAGAVGRASWRSDRSKQPVVWRNAPAAPYRNAMSSN